MLAPSFATQSSSLTRLPGRSGRRVKRTRRRPASVSWRRAIEASRPASTLPPERTATVVPVCAACTWPPSSAATPTAPAPSTTSFARSISTTIAAAVSSSPTTTTSSAQRSRSRSVRSPGRLTAIPSAIVSAEVAGTGSPRLSDSGYGAQAATCTPTTSTSGRADLIAIATPEHSPPPPTGTTTFARSGASSSSSRPSEPWPATTTGSSNGCTNASPPTSARASAASRHSSTDSPPTWISAPIPRAASTFASGASVGTKTSQCTPRWRAAAASAWPWLPADAATTPLRQPSSPSESSLAATPRTLKEPVRCRFSALSETTPPARSEIVREDSIGVRRASDSTAGRAAAISAAPTDADLVREGDDGIDLDLRSERERRHADRRARGRVGLEVGAVGLVDVLERGHVGDVDAHPDRVGELRAGGRGHHGEVLQAPFGLLADRALDEPAAHRVDRDLAAAEHEAVGDDGVRVGADGVRSSRCRDRFPMVGHNRTMPNLLAQETSPYLLQHAENPVAWHPWGEEAFALARETDRPLLVSICYSACHWCHVMERESFEDPQVAALMNERYVCVKVDREERPDVDAIYMDALQAMTGHGGWPLNAFVRPDGVPFYAGTYYPPQPRQGMPSWSQVLLGVAQAWEQQRDEIEAASQTILPRLQGAAGLEAPGGEIDPASLDAAVATLQRTYDREHGGWGGAPKFPQASVIELLLARGEREMALHTLRRMAGGGMYDQIGGGFARYSVDARWVIPHFEKMLYDNALLARAYLHGFQVSGEPFFARVCTETLDWALRELRQDEGGFASALDADSEGEEGKFYGWTPDEVRAALGDDELAAEALEHFGMTGEPNFEGRWAPVRATSDPERIEEIKLRLREAREQRVWPALDD